MTSLKIIGDDIQLFTVDGDEELRQSIERRLTTRLGEFFLNTGFGLDMDSIVGKQVDKEQVDLAIRECLLQENRILEVNGINIEITNDRKAKINFTAKTIDTTIESEVVI